MVKLAFLVLSHLKHERIQSLSDPSDGAVLLWHVATLIEIVRAGKDFLRLFKANARRGFSLNLWLLCGSKLNRICITVISHYLNFVSLPMLLLFTQAFM